LVKPRFFRRLGGEAAIPAPKARQFSAGDESQMARTLLAERRKPSGEYRKNAAKLEGSRPAATKAKSKVSRALAAGVGNHSEYAVGIPAATP